MKRPIYFVCLAISDGEIISVCLNCETKENAISAFEKQFSIKPKKIYGPFFKKRIKKQKEEAVFKFSGKSQICVYEDWIVNAVFMEDESKAFLFYKENMNNPNACKPKSHVVDAKDLIMEK